jgi:hypothetical protein
MRPSVLVITLVDSAVGKLRGTFAGADVAVSDILSPRQSRHRRYRSPLFLLSSFVPSQATRKALSLFFTQLFKLFAPSFFNSAPYFDWIRLKGNKDVAEVSVLKRSRFLLHFGAQRAERMDAIGLCEMNPTFVSHSRS